MSGAKPERGRLKPFDHTKANPQLTNELLERALSALNAKLVNSRTAAPRRVWTSKGKEFRPIALFGDARLHQAIAARLDSEDPEGPSGDAAEEAELARLEAIHGRIPLTDDHIRWHVRGCDPIGMEAYFGSYTQETREGVPGGITLAFDLDDEACEFHGKTPLQVAQDISAQVAAVGLGQYVYAYTSHGGKGVHVHVLLGFFCPSWLRKRVGEALVRLAGYPTGAGRAKGLIEVNPKGSADNLCTPLGLPLASHLVPEGRTSPLDLQSGYRTTDYLAAVELTERAPQCPREDFFAAARLLGIDPERKPEPPTFSSVTKVTIRTTSGQVADLEVASPWAEIARQVLLKLDLRRELAQFGRTVHGVKTTCPMHNEPLDGALSLTVFPATDLAGKLGIPGLEMWKCWGDCNCKGDAIKLWQHHVELLASRGNHPPCAASGRQRERRRLAARAARAARGHAGPAPARDPRTHALPGGPNWPLRSSRRNPCARSSPSRSAACSYRSAWTSPRSASRSPPGFARRPTRPCSRSSSRSSGSRGSRPARDCHGSAGAFRRRACVSCPGS
jgi:hypothetical protein